MGIGGWSKTDECNSYRQIEYINIYVISNMGKRGGGDFEKCVTNGKV